MWASDWREHHDRRARTDERDRILRAAHVDRTTDHRGRRVVTGANSGLGLVTTRELAAHGADVIMAVRKLDKGAQAREEFAPGITPRRLRLEYGLLYALAASPLRKSG